MEISLSLLPSLYYSQKAELPQRPAVYLIICDYDVVYVGKTQNLFIRFRAHDKVQRLLELYADLEIAWIECTPSRLIEIEAKLIKHFQPIINIQLKKEINKTISLDDQNKEELEKAIALIQAGLIKIIKLT